MLNIKYNPSARIDLFNILNYYNAIDDQLPTKLEFELIKIEDSILSAPELYRIRYKNVRRVNFYNFPFCIFYKYSQNKKEIHIIKITHQSSDPIFWP